MLTEQGYIIDPEFEKILPPKTPEEYEELREAISNDGEIRDPPVVWKEERILLDGHNRVKIGKEFGIKPPICEMSFASRFDAKMWVIKNQFDYRRNLNTFQKVEAALQFKAFFSAKAKANQRAAGGALPQKSGEAVEAVIGRAVN